MYNYNIINEIMEEYNIFDINILKDILNKLFLYNKEEDHPKNLKDDIEEVEYYIWLQKNVHNIKWTKKNKFFRDMKKHISKEKIPYYNYSKVRWQPIAMICNKEGVIDFALRTEPDFISASGSMYYYCEKGVYRLSNHYNRHVASCDWRLGRPRLWADWCCSHDAPEATPHWMECLAFARWEDFKFLPEAKRDPYYFFRDSMSEKGREAAIMAGLVSYDYDPINERSWTVVNCSYEELKKFYHSMPEIDRHH